MLTIDRFHQLAQDQEGGKPTDASAVETEEVEVTIWHCGDEKDMDVRFRYGQAGSGAVYDLILYADVLHALALD